MPFRFKCDSQNFLVPFSFMGSIISRFKKEKTSLELLEAIQEDIETIKCDKHTTVLKQKKYLWKLILYSVFIYCLFAVFIYFLAFPSTFRDGALYIAPLVIMPVIVFVAQKCMKWYFSRRITWNTEKLADLRARKKKILDEVMDKETFRVAREILEKFAPDQLRKTEDSLKLERKPLIESPKEIKKEIIKESAKPIISPATSLTAEGTKGYPVLTLPPSSSHLTDFPPSTQVLTPSQKRRLVRPILDPVGSRGFVDRLIEHLVGDGPSNRYALICSHCSSHNGMALREEFEFISFRCAYCGFPNPSRKVMSKRSSSASFQEAASSELTTNEDDKSEDVNKSELSESSKKSLNEGKEDESNEATEFDEPDDSDLVKDSPSENVD